MEQVQSAGTARSFRACDVAHAVAHTSPIIYITTTCRHRPPRGQRHGSALPLSTPHPFPLTVLGADGEVCRRGARLGGRDTGQSIRFFRRGNECPSHFPVHHSHASRPNFLHSAGDTECSIFGPASKLVRTRKREGHSSRGGWQSMDCWHRGG